MLTLLMKFAGLTTKGIVYNIAGIINFIKMPYFLNADELDWGGKTGLYWGGLCLLCLVWTYFRCPEMKG